MDQVMEETETENLKQVVKSRKEKPLEDFIMAFINRTQNPTVTQSMAHLLLLLAGDVAISSVVPFTYHYKILQTCAALRNDLESENKLHDMNKYRVELSDVLHSSKLHGFCDESVSFVEYLVDQIILVHNEDKSAQPSVEIPGTYNPKKGAVYYFTPHGNEVRKQLS